MARSGKAEYRALVAKWKAQPAVKRPKPAKLAGNDGLRLYLLVRVAGVSVEQMELLLGGLRRLPGRG